MRESIKRLKNEETNVQVWLGAEECDLYIEGSVA
jgi:hypothetical protein